jgi:hypothetical protein
MAFHLYMDRIVSSPPESATDTVLSECLDCKMPVSTGDCFLNPLFQDSGIQPIPVRFS